MERKELEVYSEASNLSIVRMPRRRFPGMVVQGDSLVCLYLQASLMHDRAQELGDTKLVRLSREMAKEFFKRLEHYQAVLKEYGMSFRYIPPCPGER